MGSCAVSHIIVSRFICLAMCLCSSVILNRNIQFFLEIFVVVRWQMLLTLFYLVTKKSVFRLL